MGMIFISHSSRNNSEAVAVRDWLVQNGWGPTQIFLDLDDLSGGDRWRQRLDEIGTNCEAVIVCLSDDWIRSPECTREFTHAESRGKPIFPIIVAPISDQIPRFVTDLQFVNISDPAIAETGFEKLKLGLKRAQIGPDHFSWPPASDPKRKPYRGLKALEEADAAIFFGRNAQITAGLDALRQMRSGTPHRVLMIAAASGAGKSSFLQAGLLARLNRDEENFLVLPTWRPGRDALDGKTGLLKSLGIQSAANAAPALVNRQKEIIKRLETLGAEYSAGRAAPTPILPLDQAEELFSADNATAAAAIDLLIETLQEKPDLMVVATIRSDSLGRLQADGRIAEHLSLFSLPPLPISAFKEVIEGPAALANPPIRIDPALIERLIADLDNADALPLLAFTLERLIAEFSSDNLIDLDEYESGLGGVSGAINSAVDAAMKRAALDPALPAGRAELEAIARAAFIPWLVQLDEADASPKRRVARVAELPRESHALIRHFVEERLLVSSESRGEQTYEVSHEAVLRHWRSLASWISDERIALEGLHRILRSAHEWARQDKTLSSRSADLLVHRGERLRAAEAFLQRSDMAQALRGLPLEYLSACREAENAALEQERQQAERDKNQVARVKRWQRLAAGVLVVGFALLATLGAFLAKERRNFGTAQSLMLARTARQMEESGDPRRALLLSILASRTGWLSPATAEAKAAFASNAQTLIQVLALQQEGEQVQGAAYTSDESHILTWSKEAVRLWDVASGAQIGQSMVHDGEIVGALFAPEVSRVLTWGNDRAVKLWDAQTGTQIGQTFEKAAVFSGPQFSHDGTRFVTAGAEGLVRVWNASNATQVGPDFKHEKPVRGARFSDDDKFIVTWSTNNIARVWDTNLGIEVSAPIFETDLKRAILSPDNKRLLTLSGDTTAHIWNISTGTKIGSALKHEMNLWGASFSKDGSKILTWSTDKTARLWDSATGKQIGGDFEHYEAVSGGLFSADESLLLTWGADGTARLWSVETGYQAAPSLQHQGWILGARFSPDESVILTWGEDKAARLWDRVSGAQIGPSLMHEYVVYGAKFSADGNRILSWSADGSTRVWDVGDIVKSALRHKGSVEGVIVSGDQSRLLTWSGKTVSFWNAQTGEMIGPALKHNDDVLGALYSKDEARVLSWGRDKAARLWDAETGAEIGRPMQHTDVIYVSAFSPDESQILTSGADGTAKIWNVGETILPGPVLQHQADGDVASSFSNDGKRILTWGSGNMAKQWDAESGQQLGPDLTHDDAVRWAMYSPDGDRILTLSEDSTARIWDKSTGAQIGASLQHDGPVYGARFSKNGTRILTWSRDKLARLWNTKTGALVHTPMESDGRRFGPVFSNDDALILTWNDANVALVFDTKTGKQISQSAVPHRNRIYGAAFSEDASRFLTWSLDGTARLWDTSTGAQLGPDMKHQDSINGAAFFNDDNMIVTWSDDKTARLWNVEWAMKATPSRADINVICETKLRGSLTKDDKGRQVPIVRLLDNKTIDAAPILRGREQEDVCVNVR